jgi:hypothetical protein
MTDPTHHTQDELDAGWDEDVPATSANIQSTLPAADLEKIDAGWDAPDDDGSGDAPGNASGKRGKALGKKDRRKVERQARAHQAERDLENRKSRKAERRVFAEQRAAELAAQRETHRQQELERKQQKAARRAEQQKSVPKPTPAGSAKPASVMPTIAKSAVTPNRAERRAKSSNALKPSTSTGGTLVAPKKKYAVGPFALFIGVVLVASILSYLFIH